MTNCKAFAALLDLYVDGELSPEEMLRVRDHLDKCPACRAYVDDALAIRASFPDAEDTEVPAGFTEAVMTAVRQSGTPAKASRRTPWKKILLPLAACFAVAVLVLPLRDLLSGSAKTESAASLTAMDTAVAESAAVEEPAEAPAAEEAPAALEQGALKSAGTTAEDTAPQEKKAVDPYEYATGTEAQDGGSAEPAAGQAAEEALAPTAYSGSPSPCATVTLPPEGLQLDLLAGRTPDRETEGQTEFDLTAQEYDTLLVQLDESGLDYTAQETADGDSGLVLVIVKAAN